MVEPTDARDPTGHSDEESKWSEGVQTVQTPPKMTVDVNLVPDEDKHRDQPPIRWRELIALLLLVVLSDLTIFRGEGFTGSAALFVFAPLLIWFGAPRRVRSRSLYVVSALLLVAAMKLLWCGSGLLVVCGFTLLFAFAMSLTGQVPYVLETFLFTAQTIVAGTRGLDYYGDRCRDRSDSTGGRRWLNVVMPLGAVIVFGSIFVLANPDLVAAFSERMQDVLVSIKRWLYGFSTWEIVFWCVSLWGSVGLLRPIVSQSRSEEAVEEQVALADAPLYAPFRNTLLTVIGLFAVYLAFEFRTLWFRGFPDGFYYSGYAHEGAAWLTLALGLATVLLSLIFRGRTLGDPRLKSLKKLAWIWSLENALLAVTVYHRLSIYVGFNGMTRMRVVGFLGMTCVAIGFALVVWKIIHHKRFVWLMRRQLWTVSGAVFVYAVLPVDMLVHSYNVRRILAGDPSPSVQISVHPITADGYLVLTPLLNAEDEIICDGVRAILAEQKRKSEHDARKQSLLGWTAYQTADRHLLKRLQEIEPKLRFSDKDGSAEDALERFHEYSYQWY